jgi:hypothetical protein
MLLAPKTLCTAANLCGSRGEKYGEKEHSCAHRRRSSLHAAHGMIVFSADPGPAPASPTAVGRLLQLLRAAVIRSTTAAADSRRLIFFPRSWSSCHWLNRDHGIYSEGEIFRVLITHLALNLCRLKQLMRSVHMCLDWTALIVFARKVL